MITTFNIAVRKDSHLGFMEHENFWTMQDVKMWHDPWIEGGLLRHRLIALMKDGEPESETTSEIFANEETTEDTEIQSPKKIIEGLKLRFQAKQSIAIDNNINRHLVQKLNLQVQLKHQNVNYCKWEPPVQGTLCLNTDGSLSTKKADYGGLHIAKDMDYKKIKIGSDSLQAIESITGKCQVSWRNKRKA
ncbi:hypothetical protein FRX31_011188 [Thalictrum thalictroides]|uniref:Uncharacterized protein n=1 Tax=Thalictrum thalictroides TaxID=46969 RepID=A0A7J6WQI1_THATH|nr:hypothetical protein FRX31_011188 [Thalictrum thalictroides]